jgi:hypothetical protein
MTDTTKDMNALSNSAVFLGYARPFELKWFTLEQLMEMKTTTTVEQAPLEPKSLKTLEKEFQEGPQNEPFKVISFDGDNHLGGGRHRLDIQVNKLKRDLKTVFPCLFYVVDDRSTVNRFIVGDNTTRPVRLPEKKILELSGDLNLMVGQDCLLQEYKDLLAQNNRNQVRTIFLVDVAARLANKKTPGITNTLMSMVVNGLWGRTFKLKMFAMSAEQFYYSAENVNAYVRFLEEKLPERLVATMKKHPSVTNWARDGKDILIGAGVALFNENKATLFPDKPVPAKVTETKAKVKASTPSTGSVMSKLEPPVKVTETLVPAPF